MNLASSTAGEELFESSINSTKAWFTMIFLSNAIFLIEVPSNLKPKFLSLDELFSIDIDAMLLCWIQTDFKG